MTIASETTAETPVPEGHVRFTLDGRTVDAPKNELIIRAAEREGILIPRFCDHPLLDPAAACRQCLVEVEMNGRPMPKPQPACAITVSDGMVVKTQKTSAVADKAQQGVMELLLINHPLDCPICDKGGECPLQNQALAHGRADSRFRDTKRTFTKPIEVSKQVLLDRERCILCQRCTRFSDEIAGDPFIDLIERGVHQQIGTSLTADAEAWGARTPEGTPFQSYFSGNTIQICPVGALTSAAYRFRSRPFDLVSSPSICEHCSSGCAERTDFRRGKVMRKLAGDDPEVNEEWICDRGRFAFRYVTAPDRLTRPMVRDENGQLRESSWTEALRVAADGLQRARDDAGVGVLAGGRLTVEDAYAYAKFARLALHTNDIDFRARPHSDEELAFLGSRVRGTTPENAVSFDRLERSGTVLCVAFEPEEENPAVFLRLRKAARKSHTSVVHIGQFTSPAVRKTFGTLLACPPGGEADAVRGLREHAPDVRAGLSDGVILVGERAARVPGLFAEVAALADETGAGLAWIPRRAGERGALDAGAAPTMLPGGRSVAETHDRAVVESAWGLDPGSLPGEPGRDTTGILAAAASGRLSGLVVGGVDPDDLPDPAAARAALRAAGFVVSLELRSGPVTELADVVLPVAAAVERAGSYLNWEGRLRGFDVTIENTGILPDCRVLDTLAVEMDTDLFTQTPAAARGDLERLGAVAPAREDPAAAPAAPSPATGNALLATWHQLLDNASMQDEEPHLAGTARPVVAKLSGRTAADAGVAFGQTVVVGTGAGEVELPAEEADLPDGVVWLPTNSGDCTVRPTLGADHGDRVSVRAGALGAGAQS